MHEQRTRLYAPTPLPDSHLNFYWPQDVPWLTSKQYSQRAIPPGSLKCTEPGCFEAFTSQAKLTTHLRLSHLKVSDSSLSLGYFQFGGEGVCVPPNLPAPENIPLHYCPLHTLPLGKCPVCMEVESGEGPKPPFKFFPSLEIDFKAKAALHAQRTHASTNSRAPTKVRVSKDDWEVGVYVTVPQQSDTASKIECKGRPLAMLLDRHKNGWLAVELLYNLDEALVRGLAVPRDMHRRYELVQPMLLEHPHLSEEEVVRRYFRWVPVSLVLRTFALRKSGSGEMQEALLSAAVSKINTFYVRNDL